MADRSKGVAENVDGEFFVDSTCIDCDTCRQLAPSVFADAGDYSYVHAQPGNPGDRRAALQALIACPTASIGANSKQEVREAVADFPIPIADRVCYCGFTSSKSFGGSSYFVVHPDGNWLIDSPRYVEHLVQRFGVLGGIRYIFLTHRDDVADADKYARRFDSRRIIHRRELSSQPDAGQVIDGTTPIVLAGDFVAVPTPGHTRGHCVLVYKDRMLFSGDHLWWSRGLGRLNASRSVCWYSWPQQVDSMAALRDYAFEWVLPGHGERVHLSREEMRRQLDLLVVEMKSAA